MTSEDEVDEDHDLAQKSTLAPLEPFLAQLNTLPDLPGDGVGVTRLDLSGLKLTLFPQEICQYPNLTHLNLSDNLIEVIPDQGSQPLSCLDQLVEINLSGNRLIALPSWFNRLPRLRKLDISSNPLGQSGFQALDPKVFGQRQSRRLQRLNLSQCALTSLPPVVGGLRDLEELTLGRPDYRSQPDICDNLFHSLDQTVLQFKFLIRVSAPNVHLSDLPDEICRLSHLRALDLSHNLLYWLPPSLIQLSNLEELHLSHNNIESLPYQFETLRNLSQVYLAWNSLTWITQDIGDMKASLKVLDLYQNQLDRDGTNGLGNLDLDQLDLAGNDLSLAEIRDELRIKQYPELEQSLRNALNSQDESRISMPERIDRSDLGQKVSEELDYSHPEVSEEDEEDDVEINISDQGYCEDDGNQSETWSEPSKSRASQAQGNLYHFKEGLASLSSTPDSKEDWDAHCGYPKVKTTPVFYNFEDMSHHCLGKLDFCPSDLHAKKIPWHQKGRRRRPNFEFVRKLSELAIGTRHNPHQRRNAGGPSPSQLYLPVDLEQFADAE
ncbi:hypothetical protein TCAL_04924 [Tigriopus californicus]|uniref:Uncharacterized protein n=1 Tax=Tigriopus californicus TaxID=6832 RepID=A0A553NBK7_TIGCA|nr:protein scribble homolog [Tigriopus californicus]TRY62832.1 hypothetical protein TCAL_04924 [Tigriopus californicus]|eukprot:TCALIF_04924-PA protein Name:"Similar to PIRL2 Plant intracellular Ras-group-related LRR protein 2 (Arabidopsis thaliana)" AED:0.52 eAED:0.52 QI:0/-1/0/1/-1/1/1/0/550